MPSFEDGNGRTARALFYWQMLKDGYHLEAIDRAIGEFDGYLRRKTGEVQRIERLMRQDGRFNRRQLALLGEALRQPGRTFSIPEHASVHLVSHETARLDFKRLSESGLLTRESRDGHTFLYLAPPDLEARLRRA